MVVRPKSQVKLFIRWDGEAPGPVCVCVQAGLASYRRMASLASLVLQATGMQAQDAMIHKPAPAPVSLTRRRGASCQRSCFQRCHRCSGQAACIRAGGAVCMLLLVMHRVQGVFCGKQSSGSDADAKWCIVH